MSDNRILVIDDEKPMAMLIVKIATAAGYDAKMTTDATAFFQLLAHWQPSHVVLDLNMPNVDGIQLLRQLAERGSRARVMIASGVDGKLIETAKRLSIEHGLDHVATIQKPFRAAALRQLLEQVMIVDDWCTEEALTAGIEREELCLFFQPKMNLATHRITGFEALVRWRHPEHGLVPPDRFLPLAEAGELIHPLTEQVITQALRQVREWGDATGGRVAVNLSGRSLSDVNFPDRVLAWCADVEIAPDRLQFELTETAAMQDPTCAMEILTRLRLNGITLALDDFGTGYSSLAQLAALPFTEIKIDRTFIKECESSAEAKIIVKATIDLARNLNLRTVAEGIENASVLRTVAEFGCDEAQGYHISKPLPPDEVLRWMAARHASV
jgi:EAL domain-containing protein (putative c-di-GMP-specific phosphodiesterase class I)/ActR/RegA family two-component response regulator